MELEVEVNNIVFTTESGNRRTGIYIKDIKLEVNYLLTYFISQYKACGTITILLRALNVIFVICYRCRCLFTMTMNDDLISFTLQFYLLQYFASRLLTLFKVSLHTLSN